MAQTATLWQLYTNTTTDGQYLQGPLKRWQFGTGTWPQPGRALLPTQLCGWLASPCWSPAPSHKQCHALMWDETL